MVVDYVLDLICEGKHRVGSVVFVIDRVVVYEVVATAQTLTAHVGVVVLISCQNTHTNLHVTQTPSMQIYQNVFERE